jgi:hypothetical protein
MERDIVEEKKLVEYFKKEETQKKVLELAVQIREVFGGSWFTITDCVKIFKTADTQQIIDIINTLSLCGFLIINHKKSYERLRLSGNQFKRLESELK